ncbi:AEC family transporter, partial [Pacificibacter sp. AS14]|uniref:AEC family transporter n=1 Tax=Pacificibacter sp. AS14 TaxID=3135785 RepID=UPI00317CA77D
MEILTVLGNPILPIFAIMAFGFALGRWGRTTVGEARIINRFALSVLLPVFLFNFSAKISFSGFDPRPLFTYLSAELVVFILGFLLATKILKRSAAESILLAMSGGPVTFLCRPKCSFRPLSVRMRRGFS